MTDEKELGIEEQYELEMEPENHEIQEEISIDHTAGDQGYKKPETVKKPRKQKIKKLSKKRKAKIADKKAFEKRKVAKKKKASKKAKLTKNHNK